jgi:hypothetical protein
MDQDEVEVAGGGETGGAHRGQAALSPVNRDEASSMTETVTDAMTAADEGNLVKT